MAEGKRYVYMIRAGHVVKVGCSRNPFGRWKALRPFLSVYGEPRFVGCVEGDLNDEKRAYQMAEPFPDATVREIRLGSSLPDIGEIFSVSSPAMDAIERNRRAKARRVYEALIDNRVSIDQFRRFTPHSWKYVAMLANCADEDREDGGISIVTQAYVRELYDKEGR